jgi:hypothetical protein
MNRAIAVFASLLLVVATAGTAGASGQPRLPKSAADWASFSGAEQATALQYEFDILRASLRNGTADIHEIGRTGSGTLAQANGPSILTATYDYNCPIQWVDQVGGAWFRGGGWTDVSQNVYYITASRSGLKGQFLRDGVLSGNWYQEVYNGSHAENWSGYSWRWSFESIHWVNKGWHTIRLTNGGSYLLGPDAYCTVSIQR